MRSLQNLQGADTGVALDNLLTFQVAPALSGYTNTRADQFYDQLLERRRSAPGIKTAGIASVPILSGNEWDSYTAVEGYQARDGENMQAYMNALSPGYFATMNIPIVEGRDFTALDARPSPTVAIVNQRFARHFFPGRSAIGKRLARGGGSTPKFTVEIIGVVADSLYEGPREGVRRQVFCRGPGPAAPPSTCARRPRPPRATTWFATK